MIKLGTWKPGQGIWVPVTWDQQAMERWAAIEEARR